jgi:hypothetical protein
MRSRKTGISVCLFFSFLICRGEKSGSLPEITPVLGEENLLILKTRPLADRLFATVDGFLFVEPEGSISKFDFRSGMIVDRVHLLASIEEAVMAQNGLLALKQAGIDRWIVLDPATMRTCGEFGIRDVVGVNGRYLVYRSEGRLMFAAFPKGNVLASVPLGSHKLLGCVFLEDTVLAMTEEKLLRFSPSAGRVQEIDLAEKPVSGFLYDRGDIYYGSSSRRLIRFSLGKKKSVWKLKLGGLLSETPLKLARHICVLPLDQNAYFVNFSGAVSWWMQLDSIRQYPPVTMSENLAVFLMNGEVKFLNPRRKTVRGLKLTSRALGGGISGRGYVYFPAAGESGGETEIARVGNRIAIDISAESPAPRFSGQSLVFSLVPRNLVKPVCKAKLFDDSGKLILEKEFAAGQNLRILWIPEKSGDYLLQAEARGANAVRQNQLKVAIIDWNDILGNFFFHW